MLEIISAKSGLAKKYKIKKGDKILGFDGYEAEDVLDYLFTTVSLHLLCAF